MSPPTTPSIQQIDHIGIAVHSLDTSIKKLQDTFGLTLEKTEEVPSQKMRTAFFQLGEVHLELLEPTDASSPIARFLEKRGEGFHHIAFRTDDIRGALNQASDSGCTVINEEPIEGANGKMISFLHPKSLLGLLIELCMTSND